MGQDISSTRVKVRKSKETKVKSLEDGRKILMTAGYSHFVGSVWRKNNSTAHLCQLINGTNGEPAGYLIKWGM